ncbi:MAG: hypothetical protein ACYSWR_07310 [Planctomycetota bacterium]|jgi:hypothetical protein
MTESNKEKGDARPASGRAFFKQQHFALPDLKAQLIFWPLVAAGLALDLWSKKAELTPFRLWVVSCSW